MKGSPGILEQKNSVLLEREVGHRDPLTRLANRVYFEDRVSDAIHQYRRRQQPFALVSIELDGFAEMDERYGRRVADQALKILASALQHALRRGDLLGRLRGELFSAIIFDAANPQQILPAVSRLMNAAIDPIQVGELTLQVSTSIGVAFYPQEQEVEVAELMEQSERAMAQAQRAGRNLYHFGDPAHHDSIEEISRRIDRIRVALEEREFVLHYQPKVLLGAGEVYGVEALIRWQHPERGLLAPGEFLPLIDDHRLAIELGEWVIESVLAQLALWEQKGLRLTASINMNQRHMLHPEFPARLAAILDRFPTGLAQRLELELHGGNNYKALTAVLQACRNLGVMLALDHFGTSSSSLLDLKRLPVQIIKIDALFVRDLLDEPDNVAIVESIVALAETMGRQCVAEGVENAEQGLQLIRLGCERAQGYGIAVPMEADQLPDWIANWSPDPGWGEATTIGVEERLLVYTSVEHKAWISALEAFLNGERDEEPKLGRHQCQLGHFIDVEEQAGRNSHPSFQTLAALHWRIHAIGAGIPKLHSQGKQEEAFARLADLQGFFEKLLDQLKAFRMKI
jgi:diguanylate cyclase (GGDEF)-like protein